MRAFHGRLQRLLTGAVAAALLVVIIPAPATAAPTPIVAISDVTVTEGTGGTVNANFTIQAAPSPKGGTLQVSWATAAGSATSPADFTASSGTVSLRKNDASKVVSVPVIGDALNEPNETFSVNLTNLVALSGRIGDAQGVATIIDDDAAPVLSVNDVSVTEGNAGTTTATFTVTLSAASGRTVTFDWATSPGTATAGVDYVTASGSRTIAVGATSATIAITVNGDVVPELDETFRLTLSNPGNATIGDAVGLGTILDDELEAVIDIDDPTVIEANTGTTTLSFGVRLSNPSVSTVTVDWATSDGTATAGSDYLGDSGTVTFAPLDTSETVQVTVYGDTTYEPDETVALNLSNPTNAPIGKAHAIGTILNDDKAPTSLTLQVLRKLRTVVANGLLEPATSGEHVTVTLFRKKGGKFVEVSAKTVLVRYLKDRDGDGKTDGSYTATLVRPKAKGTYKIVTQFKGTANYKPCLRGKVFTLTAS